MGGGESQRFGSANPESDWMFLQGQNAGNMGLDMMRQEEWQLANMQE